MKAIVVFSGGLDSTVLLSQAVLEFGAEEVGAISFNYGQRHKKELEHAIRIARHLEVAEHRVVDLSSIKALLGGSSLTDDSIEVPEGHYAEESMKATVVPNRNMIMIALAGAWAISQKSNFVYYGAHAGDHAVYPDCRKEFIDKMAESLVLADWHRIKLVAPFVALGKHDIAKRGQEIGAPMAASWSCYKGGEKHCGRCGTCVERKEAFQLAGVADPTNYEEVKA